MLNPLNSKAVPIPELAIGKAEFPAPFASTLEYNPPARGPWNIVHTGMLLPESHQIFACAQGCLRGVILTAAEMLAMDRMSWIAVTEDDMFNGHLEDSIVDGTADIIAKMPKPPRAILLFVSCIHLFAGCDVQNIIRQLSQRFPDIGFVDCYMTPTMRFSGLNPDMTMRRQLYHLLPNAEKDPRAINIIGNDRPTPALESALSAQGFTVRDITKCRSFDEYLQMANATLNITTFFPAKQAGIELEKRLGQKHLHLPMSYNTDEICRNANLLAKHLALPTPDLEPEMQLADRALEDAVEALDDMPIAIDATATPRPIGLARRLLEAGFNVQRVYGDIYSPEEAADFTALQWDHPELGLSPIVHPSMEFAPPAAPNHRILAIGQKAAWYEQAPHFVNMVSGNGLYGFSGIATLAEMMQAAIREPKDFHKILQHKGFGCPSCLA